MKNQDCSDHTVTSDEIRDILATIVVDRKRVDTLGEEDSLFDKIPELDSVGCVNLVLAIEQRFGFEIDDVDINESLFASLSSLKNFVEENITSGEVRRPTV